MKKETRNWEPIAPATARFMALEQMAQAMSSKKRPKPLRRFATAIVRMVGQG